MSSEGGIRKENAELWMDGLDELFTLATRMGNQRHWKDVLTEAQALFSQLLRPDILPKAMLDPELKVPLRYLLRRRQSLTLFAIASPPGFISSVHDHGSCGLVGQISGEELESLYEQNECKDDLVRLRLTSERVLRPKDVVSIIPPDRDLHQVTTVSPKPSLSLHAFMRDPLQQGFTWFEPQWFLPTAYRGSYDNEYRSRALSAGDLDEE